MVHLYKLGGYNIAVDAASGSIHCLDDVSYDAIGLYVNGDREETAKRLGEIYGGLEKSGIIELLDEIDELISLGKLFSVSDFSAASAKTREAPLKALCMNVSHMCNMTCSYCFAGRGEYSGEKALMSYETGKRAIDFLVENSGNRINLDVDFFGGEPLLNWGVVKRIVGYARSLEKESGKVFRFTLTTNGLLIDDDVIDFTNREMDNVVLSLDGRPEINDAARKLPNGAGSYALVLPKIKKLVESRGGKNYYIRGTYTSANPDFAEDVLFIADLGFKELSMEPVVAKRGDRLGLTDDNLPGILDQYERLAAEMLRREKAGKGFTFYHYKLDLESGPCIYKRIAGCGVGTEYLAVTPGGDLYPCHQFIGDEKFLIGDIWRGITGKTLRDEFSSCDIYTRAECRVCWARLYCSGGCAANAYNDTGSIDGVYKLGCEMFKKRLECAIMMNVHRKLFNLSVREADTTILNSTR